jgi:N6-L-threonylcarbamoyladenine synthase
LGIESSCDETAAALVDDGRTIRSNVVFSQEDLHRRFGGVVPELASRQHLLGIVPAVERALADAGAGWSDVSAVAVSYGPGLAGSLLVGVNAAKAIAIARGLPLVGVNHLEGHVYANWLIKPDSRGTTRTAGKRRAPAAPRFPLLCLVVSGGHTELVLMRAHGDFTLLGRTRDDAAGEAFDKVARILGLGYPGGPAVQRAAEQAGDTIPAEYQLTRPWLRGTYDFSFSGLKTAVLRIAEGGADGPVGNPSRLAAVAPAPAAAGGSADGSAGDADGDGTPLHVAQLAAAFQQAVVDVLASKAIQAAAEHGAKQIALAGGVAANRYLRETLAARSSVPVLRPDIDLCTDNAAMIAAAGYFRLQRGDVAGWDLDVNPNLRLA